MRGACEEGQSGGGDGSGRSGRVGGDGGCGLRRIVGGLRKVVVQAMVGHSQCGWNRGGVHASSWLKVKGFFPYLINWW